MHKWITRSLFAVTVAGAGLLVTGATPAYAADAVTTADATDPFGVGDLLDAARSVLISVMGPDAELPGGPPIPLPEPNAF